MIDFHIYWDIDGISDTSMGYSWDVWVEKNDKGLNPWIIWAKLFGTWSFRISFGIHQVSYYLLGDLNINNGGLVVSSCGSFAMLIHAYTIFGGDEHPQIPAILVGTKRYQGFDGPEASCQLTRWYFPSQKMEGWSSIKGIQKPECPLL
jgi:hypothetical protein